jgi:hypothetical protein
VDLLPTIREGDGGAGALDRAGQRLFAPALSRFPNHREHTSRSRQSGTGVSAPYRATISAGSGSTWWLHALHHTMSRTRAAAALPSVIGGPGGDFMSLTS